MKQSIFNRNFYLKTASWTAVHLAWMTMSISPVALGKQAEATQTEILKAALKEYGLTQKMTMGQFWEKNKGEFPGYIYKDVESFMTANRTKLMPAIELKVSKSAEGESVPTLTYTIDGKSHTIQVFGKDDKFIKFDGVTLTEKDIQVPGKVMEKMIKADPKINRDFVQKQKQEHFRQIDEQKHPYRDFDGLPKMTKQMWNAMTVQQRAAFIVEMRLLNARATGVKLALGVGLTPPKPKKTSALDEFKLKNYVWAWLIGRDAEAIPYYTGQHCINQGFIASDATAYNKGSFNYRTGKKGAPLEVEACNLETILDSPKYKENALVQKARQYCQTQKKMPCNPEVYSFNSSGNAYCAESTTDQNYQMGTSYQGVCDAQSRLSKNFIDASEQGLKKADQQGKGKNDGKDLTKVDREAIIAKLKEDQAKESFQLTEDYLSGMLKAKNKDNLQTLLIGKQWSQDLEDEILTIQKAFEENIKTSMDLCSADLKDVKQKKHEDNYRDACEQLHRRWLFSKEIIAMLKCKDGTSPVVDQATGKKACIVPVPPVVVQPPKPKCPAEGAEPYENEVGRQECVCTKNSSNRTFLPTEKLPDWCKDDAMVQPPLNCEQTYGAVAGMDKQTCKCLSTGEVPTYIETNPERVDKFECKASKGINWKLILGIGAGIALLALLFKKKNKSVNTTCTNGGTPPECKLPTVCANGGTPPDCKLPTVCANGGTPPECKVPTVCANGGTPPECKIISMCSNGGTPPTCVIPTTCTGAQELINGVCQCRSTCTNGGTQNPVSCTCSAPPGEGGTGTNPCPNPPCSGGLPPATGI